MLLHDAATPEQRAELSSKQCASILDMLKTLQFDAGDKADLIEVMETVPFEKNERVEIVRALTEGPKGVGKGNGRRRQSQDITNIVQYYTQADSEKLRSEDLSASAKEEVIMDRPIMLHMVNVNEEGLKLLWSLANFATGVKLEGKNFFEKKVLLEAWKARYRARVRKYWRRQTTETYITQLPADPAEFKAQAPSLYNACYGNTSPTQLKIDLQGVAIENQRAYCRNSGMPQVEPTPTQLVMPTAGDPMQVLLATVVQSMAQLNSNMMRRQESHDEIPMEYHTPRQSRQPRTLGALSDQRVPFSRSPSSEGYVSGVTALQDTPKLHESGTLAILRPAMSPPGHSSPAAVTPFGSFAAHMPDTRTETAKHITKDCPTTRETEPSPATPPRPPTKDSEAIPSEITADASAIHADGSSSASIVAHSDPMERSRLILHAIKDYNNIEKG